MKRIQLFIILISGFMTLSYSQRLICTDSVNYIGIGGLRLNFVILDSIIADNLDLLTVPKYSLGEQHLEKYLIGSIQFPDDVLEDTTINLNRFEADAIVSFVIDKAGNVNDSIIVKGFRSSTEKDIINTLNKLQRFEPGKYNDKPVDIRLTLKIKYKT